MDIQNSVLGSDIKYVIENPDLSPYRLWGAQVYAKGVTEHIGVLKLLTIDTIENYSAGFTETITIDIVMGLGAYSKLLYPNREDLEVVLTRFNPDGSSDSETFKAYLMTEDNPVVDQQTISNIGQYALDISNVVPVRLQLLNKAVDQLRLVTVGGVYRQTTVESLIRGLVTLAASEIDVADEDRFRGVEFVDGSNDTEYEQIIIPHGTRLPDLPGYLQEKQFGIYPSGLGHFYKNGIWYLYPVFDSERFNVSRFTLEILVVPQNQLPGIDRTYRTRGSNTTLIATGPRQLEQGPEHEQAESGAGVRFADATSMITQFVDVLTEPNKAIASRGVSNTEVVNADQSGELNNAPVAGAVITSNKFRELSTLASRAGSYYTCVWEYSDPELLHPGMSARVKYLDGNDVRLFEGIVVGCTHSTHLAGTGITTNAHYTVTSLTLFVKKDLDIGG